MKTQKIKFNDAFIQSANRIAGATSFTCAIFWAIYLVLFILGAI